MQFEDRFEEIFQPGFRRHREGIQGSWGFCRFAASEALRQVLVEFGDFVGIRIILSLRPLDHLLNAVAGVVIVIDPDPAIECLAQGFVESHSHSWMARLQFFNRAPNA